MSYRDTPSSSSSSRAGQQQQSGAGNGAGSRKRGRNVSFDQPSSSLRRTQSAAAASDAGSHPHNGSGQFRGAFSSISRRLAQKVGTSRFGLGRSRGGGTTDSPSLRQLRGDEAEPEPVFFDYGAAASQRCRSLLCRQRGLQRRTLRRTTSAASYVIGAGMDQNDRAAAAANEARRQQSRRQQEARELSRETQRMRQLGLEVKEAQSVIRPIVYTFNPDSVAKSAWDWFVIILVVFNTLFVPFELAFRPPLMETTNYTILDTVIDWCFVVDIFVTLNTAVPTAWGRFEHHRCSIFLRYLRGMLIVDVLAVLPLPFLASLFGGNAELDAVRVLKLVRLLRLGRLMRKMEQMSAANALRIVKLLLGFLVLAHLLGCMWFMLSDRLLACANDLGCASSIQPQDTWAFQFVERGADMRPTLWDKYTHSLYFMLTTMTTVGYGDTHPLNHVERSVACGVLILASVVYAVIFGSVAVQISEFDKSGVRFQERMSAVQEFFRINPHVSETLHTKTLNYTAAMWTLHRGIDHQAVLAELPLAVKQEVMTSLHKDLIELVPLFKNANEGFIKALVLVLRPQVALQGDFVVREGDAATSMYFVHHGRVQFERAADPDDQRVVGRGCFFGAEILLLDGNTGVTGVRRRHSVKALDLCHLYVLSLDDYQEVVTSFPEYVTQLREVAHRRMEVQDMRERLRRMASRREAPSTAITDDELEEGGSGEEGVGASRKGSTGGGGGSLFGGLPTASSRWLRRLETHPEATIAARIMQMLWRYRRSLRASGRDFAREVAYRLQQRALFTELYFAIKRRQMAQQGTRRTEQEVYTPNLVPVPTGRDSEALEYEVAQQSLVQTMEERLQRLCKQQLTVLQRATSIRAQVMQDNAETETTAT